MDFLKYHFRGMQILPFVKAFAGTLSLIYLIDETFQTSIIVYFAIWCGLFFFFQHEANRQITKYTQSIPISVLFSVFIILGNDWLGKFLDNFSLQSVILFCCVCSGIFFVFCFLSNMLFAWLDAKVFLEDSGERKDAKHIFLKSFALLWIVYFLFFLNQYPGSMTLDAYSQLKQALGDMPYENANPVFHTLVWTVFVKLGVFLFGNINAGVAAYTVFQLTLTACIFAYTVSVIYRCGFHKYLVFASHIFFNCMPYNIVYACSMQKDTFFAILFLLTLTYLFSMLHLEKKSRKESKTSITLLFILALITSLSRNSGWCALLPFGICLMIYAVKRRKNDIKKMSIVLLSGVAVSWIITLGVYPLCGVTGNGGITVGLSVPLQQISRVVAYQGEISEKDASLINEALDIERIAELYEESISDPIKFNVDAKVIEDNLAEYGKLWIRLGLKNPKVYWDAYIQLTKNYWFLDTADWVWDTRICDNDYGVTRDAVLLPQRDGSHILGLVLSFPKGYIFNTSSIALWLSAIFFSVAHKNKNMLGMVFFCPIFSVFAGLMLTSPVASFRYTYCISVCLPLILCMPYLGTKKQGNDEFSGIKIQVDKG